MKNKIIDITSVPTLIGTTKPTLQEVCEYYRGRDEDFRFFVLDLARHKEPIEISCLFKTAREMKILDSFFLKALEVECKRGPKELVICSEIQVDHDLLYTEDSGFFEYTGDIWERRSDTDIKAYISKALGFFATGNKVESTFKLLKTKCNSHQEFNKKNLISFQNGTLELDTGTLRKPIREDFLTIKMNYNYDSNADCENWLNFVDLVMSHDKGKIRLLQEITGYCLFPENNLDVCSFLLGKGANGKSVFLKTIEELFGKENISHLALDELNKPFERIKLKNSIINLSSEQKPNARGVEALFKQITSGDTITGSEKFKNSVDFVPHAKMIVAANNFVNLNDIDYAIERRMLFLYFKETFVSQDPVYGQHGADIELPHKLKKELSGIFNWAYNGYKMLKETQRFTMTEEHYKTMQEFKETVDPVTAFVTEWYVDADKEEKKISNLDAYNNFRDWARVNGHKVELTAQSFKIKFKRVFLEQHPAWESYRRAHDRGVQIKGLYKSDS